MSGVRVNRKIFLDNLPRWETGARIGCINWKASIGHKVKFVYDDVEGEVEIISHEGEFSYIKYKDNEPFKISNIHFKKCVFGELLGTFTHNFKIEINTVLESENRYLTIVDREYRIDKKGQYLKYYKYVCGKCGLDNWSTESNLLKGTGCSRCCTRPRIVQEKDSIPNTAPWMIPYFINGYDEAKQYNKGSSKKVLLKCPDCGRIKEKPIAIGNLNRDKSIGCPCGDGKSYPFKLTFSILQQMNTIFETEFSPKWCKYKYKNKHHKGRYDFYFEKDNSKYIVEVDGWFHYNNNSMNGQSLKYNKHVDKTKDRLANKHGIEVIRIDCKESELEYIKNNILKSKLNELFDLNNIDWNKAEEYALSNICKSICEYKKDNYNLTTTDIGKVFNLSNGTIRTYLKKGTVLGWVDYSAEKESNIWKEKVRKNNKKRGKMVQIFKDDILLGVFESTMELERQSENLFAVKIANTKISQVCNGKKPQYKGFTFKYIDKDNINPTPLITPLFTEQITT